MSNIIIKVFKSFYSWFRVLAVFLLVPFKIEVKEYEDNDRDPFFSDIP